MKRIDLVFLAAAILFSSGEYSYTQAVEQAFYLIRAVEEKFEKLGARGFGSSVGMYPPSE